MENEKLGLVDSVVEEDKDAGEDGVFEVRGTGPGFGCMSPALTINTISQVTDTEINR